MTEVDSVVQVGAAAGQAAIDAVADYPAQQAPQATAVAVLQVLKLQADELRTASETDQQLLTAYRSWLGAAIAYFTGTGPVRDYAMAAAILTAEISLSRKGTVMASVGATSSDRPEGNNQL